MKKLVWSVLSSVPVKLTAAEPAVPLTVKQACWYAENAPAFRLLNVPTVAPRNWTVSLSNCVAVVVSAVVMRRKKQSCVAEVGIVTVWLSVLVWVVS